MTNRGGSAAGNALSRTRASSVEVSSVAAADPRRFVRPCTDCGGQRDPNICDALCRCCRAREDRKRSGVCEHCGAPAVEAARPICADCLRRLTAEACEKWGSA